jgi:hypothetical protein
MLLVAVTVISVAWGGANGGADAAGSASSVPALHYLGGYPVAFRGTGFRPRERVVVTAVGGKRVVRRTVANGRGAFTLTFPGVDAGACTAFWATAVGNRGSRASFRRSPGLCPAP